MRVPKHRKVVEERQLHAIARVILSANPSMPDSEWKAEIKARLLKLEFDEPDPERLSIAMTSVDCAWTREHGPREGLPRLAPALPGTTQGAPLTRTQASTTLRALLERLRGSQPSGHVSSALPPETVDYVVSEAQALAEFWRCVSQDGADRIAVLRSLAAVRIERPPDWDYAKIRATAGEHTLRANGCFGCATADRGIDWHHVIQVQHGGSNSPRNRVALCEHCHADVHPWLVGQSRRVQGWTRVGELGGSVALPARMKDTA